MKPIIIIAIAVVCSVVAVFGVTYVPGAIMMIVIEIQEQPIVDAFNYEAERCRNTFTNISSKKQCEYNNGKNFEVWKLSDNSFSKLESVFTDKDRVVMAERDALYADWAKYGGLPESLGDAIVSLERYKADHP
jgi:hypothetical protein